MVRAENSLRISIRPGYYCTVRRRVSTNQPTRTQAPTNRRVFFSCCTSRLLVGYATRQVCIRTRPLWTDGRPSTRSSTSDVVWKSYERRAMPRGLGKSFVDIRCIRTFAGTFKSTRKPVENVSYFVFFLFVIASAFPSKKWRGVHKRKRFPTKRLNIKHASSEKIAIYFFPRKRTTTINR